MRACVLVSCLAFALVTSSCDRNCDDDGDCDVGFTCPVVFADECARTCTARPLRGETCSRGSDSPSCEDFSLACDGALVCAERGNDGASVGTCAPTEGRVLNETCSSDDECEGSLVCASSPDETAGECAPATGRGTDVPCDDDAQCASGSCSGGACS